MKTKITGRRKFLQCAGGFGLAAMGASASPDKHQEDWMKRLTGKHKMVFDTITPFNGFQVVWPLTFLETYNQAGTPDEELNAVVILRNKAVAMALDDKAWKKYKLGRFFKITDFVFNADADRNLYWDPPQSELPEAGSSIRQLMSRGVIFCVCEKALSLNSAQVARSRTLDPLAVRADWYDSMLPGIQPVPSGVWALNQVQERGASYCYAG